MRTGWFTTARIESRETRVNRAALTAQEALVLWRVKLANQIRGLLQTFGTMFVKPRGGLRCRAEEFFPGELAVAPEMLPIFPALVQARRNMLTPIARLDSRIRAIARRHDKVRLLMTIPGVGAISALAVLSAFDGAPRFRRSSGAGAWRGLTPRRCDSGEIRRNRRLSKRGDGFTRNSLCEAANAIICRSLRGPCLRTSAKVIAERPEPKKPRLRWPGSRDVSMNTTFREAPMA